MSTDWPSWQPTQAEPALSPEAIIAIADVVTGGPGSSTPDPRYGVYRSASQLKTFFANCGVYLNDVGMSRVPAVRKLLTEINTQPDGKKILARVIEATVAPTAYQDKGKHAEAVEHLNERLKSDGLVIRKSGARWRLQPADSHAPVAAAVQEQAIAMDFDSVHRDMERALREADNDPEDAITSACSGVESVCRCILQEMQQPLPDNKDISHLVAEVQRHLELSPKQPDVTADLKRILGGLSNVASGIGSLRTHAGDAHGKSKGEARVDARVARLAIHAAATISLFFRIHITDAGNILISAFLFIL